MLLVIGVVIVVRNIRTIGANVAQAALVQQVDQSSLPADQKAGIKVHIDRLTADFKSGKSVMLRFNLKTIGDIRFNAGVGAQR